MVQGPIDNVKFNNRCVLNKFRKIVNEIMNVQENLYECSACNKDFKTLALFNRHRKTHNLSCEKCSQTFKTFNQLRQHNKDKHPKQKFYKCKVCPDLTYSCEKEYLLHLRNDHEGKIIESHMCNMCGKTFRTSSELTLHIRSKCGTEKQFICKVEDSVALEALIVDFYVDIFRLQECGQKLMSPGSLYTHMKRHKGENSFMCRFCAKLFLTSGQLKVHERIHTQQKVFVCEVCGKGFCHRQSLITHISVHTGIKPYQCENCGKAFSCVGNLLKHRRTHSDTCGLIPMTSHRVQNPSTKIKVRINTPASSKLKRMQMKKELEEKFANLENDKKIKVEAIEVLKTSFKDDSESADDFKDDFSDNEDSKNLPDSQEIRSSNSHKKGKISIQDDDVENFIKARKLTKGKTATCSYCHKEYSNFKWLFKHEQEHFANDVKEKLLHICSSCKLNFDTSLDLLEHQKQHTDNKDPSWTSRLTSGLKEEEKESLRQKYPAKDFITKHQLQLRAEDKLLNTVQKQLCCGLSALDKVIVKLLEKDDNVDILELLDSAKIFADIYYVVSNDGA